jgi:hypothetical protein
VEGPIREGQVWKARSQIISDGVAEEACDTGIIQRRWMRAINQKKEKQVKSRSLASESNQIIWGGIFPTIIVEVLDVIKTLLLSLSKGDG